MGAANQTTVTLVPPTASLQWFRSGFPAVHGRVLFKPTNEGPPMRDYLRIRWGRCKPSGPPWQPQRNEVKVANVNCLFLMKKQVAQAHEDEGIDFTDVTEVTDFSQAKRLSEYGTCGRCPPPRNYSLQSDGAFLRTVNSVTGTAFTCSI